MIPGEAYYISFQKKPQKFKKTFFFIILKEGLLKTAKKRKAKTLKNSSKKNWVMIKPTAYGGLLMLVLLSKIEGNYTFNATNLNKNAVKNYLKLLQI